METLYSISKVLVQMEDFGVLGIGRDGYLGNPPRGDGQIKVSLGVDWPIMEDLDKIFFILCELGEGAIATGHVPYFHSII